MIRRPWRYALARDVALNVPALAGVTWQQADGLAHIEHGQIHIRAGYAWDGCSPKVARPFLDMLHLGIPDGPWHLGTTPTYHASLVHDVLCQWRREIPVTRRQSIQAFDDLLRLAGWRYRWLYVTAVRLFGPRQFGPG
jgi:hypothetical protein